MHSLKIEFFIGNDNNAPDKRVMNTQYMDKLESVVQGYFDSYTLINALGYFNTEYEKCVKIETIKPYDTELGLMKYKEVARACAERLRRVLGQQCVLVTFTRQECEFVEVEKDLIE